MLSDLRLYFVSVLQNISVSLNEIIYISVSLNEYNTGHYGVHRQCHERRHKINHIA